jgi:thymidine kinase
MPDENVKEEGCACSGQIQLILGSMFSGKTSELMRRVRRYMVAKRKCLVIKYALDKRYSDECAATHDGVLLKALSCSKLADIDRKMLSQYDVIAVDEGSFFSDVVEFCEEMANLGKIVIVASLDGTFQRKAFGKILELIPMSESVVKLLAVCMMCHGEAAFTLRLGTETQVEVIGGTEKYMSVCRKCYFAASRTLLSKL